MDEPRARAEALEALLGRRSVSPRRLGPPAPTQAQLETAIRAALRAPDHGALTPWRAVLIPDARRSELAQQFIEEKQRRNPAASDADLRRAASHALDAPALLAFIVSIRAQSEVPAGEQWLAAGAALGNLLNALHLQDVGAIMLSGARCADPELARSLGVQPGEQLIGFISAGKVVEAPREAQAKVLDVVWSVWPGSRAAVASDRLSAAATAREHAWDEPSTGSAAPRSGRIS